MSVVLTSEHTATPAGQQLLELVVKSALDGRLDLEEIKELRRWLLANKDNTSIPAVPYLLDIMTRITADKVIDRDELLELHLAVERIIPATYRAGVKEARREREAEAKKRLRERQREEKAAAKAREKEEKQLARAEAARKRKRFQRAFSKIAGVSFPNDDGTERQEILRHCQSGELLELRYEPSNPFSVYATQVLRATGQQLGHVPEYLAQRVCEAKWSGVEVCGVLLEVTGGSFGKAMRGANFAIIFADADVSRDELDAYILESIEGRG